MATFETLAFVAFCFIVLQSSKTLLPVREDVPMAMETICLLCKEPTTFLWTNEFHEADGRFPCELVKKDDVSSR